MCSFRGECNLVMDASTSGWVVKSVFYTAAFAGYPHLNFVVQRARPGADGSSFGRLPIDPQLPGPPSAPSRPFRPGPPPRLREGAVRISGGAIAPDVIVSVVRRNFGRFRLCYEQGLSMDSRLQGRVTVKFAIDPGGAVSIVEDGGSDLADPGAIGCIVRAFGELSFPAHDAPPISVVYPILFSPGD